MYSDAQSLEFSFASLCTLCSSSLLPIAILVFLTEFFLIDYDTLKFCLLKSTSYILNLLM